MDDFTIDELYDHAQALKDEGLPIPLDVVVRLTEAGFII